MDYAAARRQMVDSQVRPNNVPDIDIQNALLAVPREEFLPSDWRAQAYVERELAYAPGRSLVTARDFAKLLMAAHPSKSDLTLAPACGGGYVVAVLATLTDMVVAVEDNSALATAAEETLSALGVANAAVVEGDPSKGAPDQGPFDLIFIAQAVEETPEHLLSQLADGGRLAAIERADEVARGVVITRTGAAYSKSRRFDATARIVPEGFEAKKAFAF
ncbi:MAG: protein-L-isoaspartate O-methyltransferase [Pseudomonadota bacterium]